MAEAAHALVRISDVSCTLHDVVQASDAFAGACDARVLSGTVQAIASDLAATHPSGSAQSRTPDLIAALAGRAIVALTTVPLKACMPGATIAIPIAELIVVPATLPRRTLMSALATALRGVVSLLCRINPHSLRGSVLVLGCADASSNAAAILASQLGCSQLLLATRSAAEYEAAHEWAPGSAVLIRPDADLLSAVASATGGLGADVILELSDAACLAGMSPEALHPAVRDLCIPSAPPASAAPAASAGGCGEAAEAAVAQTVPPPAVCRAVDESLLLRCLAPHGHWLTTRGGAALEIDAPLTELLRAKAASLHCVNVGAWVDLPRWQGVLLHAIQRIVDDVAKGAMTPPAPRIFPVPTTAAAAASADAISAGEPGGSHGAASAERSSLSHAEADASARVATVAIFRAALRARLTAALQFEPGAASAGAASGGSRAASAAADGSPASEAASAQVVLLSLLE